MNINKTIKTILSEWHSSEISFAQLTAIIVTITASRTTPSATNCVDPEIIFQYMIKGLVYLEKQEYAFVRP